MLITTSEFPGTTLDLIEIPLDEHSSIYDSPGIVNRHQIAHIVDEKELQNINGVGEAKAKSIIEYREENGLFTTIEDIKNVPGIGDSLFEKIKAYITV